MNRPSTIRVLQLIAFVSLAMASSFGQSRANFVDANEGVTLNGIPVYLSAGLHSGDNVRTADAETRVVFADAELRLAPNTAVTFGVPIVVSCGAIMVDAGSLLTSDGNTTELISAGYSAKAMAGVCGNSLPDAPSSVTRAGSPGMRRSHVRRRSEAAVPMSVGIGLTLDPQVADKSYFAVNGAMYSSSIVTAELAQRCLAAQACQVIPGAFRGRAAMYAIGLPLETGVAYLGYYLKSKKKSWWFVPAALVTAADVVVASHAAKYGR
jgi:hypothetical protein